MKLPIKTFISLPVQSRSGLDIGRVSGAELDTESGKLQTIHVRSSGLVKGLMNDEALIDWSQVIEITDKAVIVDDMASKKAEVKEASREAMRIPSASPAMQSEFKSSPGPSLIREG